MTNEQELTKDSEFLKDQRERLGHALMSSLLTFADFFFFFFYLQYDIQRPEIK